MILLALFLLAFLAILWSWCALMLTARLDNRLKRLDDKLAEHLSLDSRYDRH